MLKRDAIEVFGGVTKLADAVGYSHPSICRWPEKLSQAHSDQVRGAMVRLRKQIPSHMRSDENDEERLAEFSAAA